MASSGVTVKGLDECLASFKNLDAELRRNANGELRKAATQIAAGIVPMLGGSGAPQENRILEAAAPKSDRYVVVAVPNRKPKLSGMKKTPAGRAKLIGFAVEAGSDEPQFQNPAAGAMVGRHQKAMGQYAVPRYQAVLAQIMRKYNLI